MWVDLLKIVKPRQVLNKTTRCTPLYENFDNEKEPTISAYCDGVT